MDGSALPKRFRSRNLGAALLWFLVAAAGAAYLVLRAHGVTVIAVGAIVVFALQASFVFWQGVTLDAGFLAFPHAFLPIAPIFVFGRAKIACPLLRDLTAAGRFLQFDVVLLSSSEKTTAVLFGSRAKKLTFFEAIKAMHPEIRIYRAI